MAVAPSFQDFYDVILAEFQARRPDLLVAEGDVTDAMISGGGAANDLVLRFAAMAFRETFMDGAMGDALTALVDDRLGIQRNPATAAQGVVAFTRPFDAGSEPAGTILAGTVVATGYDVNGETVEFGTDIDLIFGLGVLGPLSVDVTAGDTGRTGNAIAGSIVRIVDTIPFDSTFTVTNALACAGGNAEESDVDLRRRAKSFWTTLRRGTLGALEQGAREVDSVRVAIATEDLATGIVMVRIADSDGNSTVQMVSDVETELEDWRCGGVPITVLGGTQLTQAVTVAIAQHKDGFDVTARTPDIQDAVGSRMEKLRVGEVLYLDSLIAAIIAVAPDDIWDVNITVPSGDVTPGAGQAIRAGTVTVS